MPILFLRLIFLLLCISLGACATNIQQEENKDTAKQNNKPLLAIPLQPEYRFQVELLRLEQMMSQHSDNPDELANLYFQRGAIYDQVGLHTLARLDFSRALKLRRDFADAYNFIGVYLTLEQQFHTAFETFDSAIELSPNLEFAYLNRGIALHYAGKNKLALNDMETFLSLNSRDPYRVLWHYFVSLELNPEQAKTLLHEQYRKNANDEWGWKIIAALAGLMTEKELYAQIDGGQVSDETQAEYLCEAYFYLGKQKLKQDAEAASYYFKLAASTNVYGFIEHRYALLELELLAQHQGQDSQETMGQ